MSDRNEELSFDTDNGDAAVATQAPPKPASTQPKRKQLPPYKVLLHNDDVNTVEHVIHYIMKLTGFTVEDAIEKTIEAHNTGVALLLVTHKERAELYHDQFTSAKLTVSIEPDSE